MLEGELQWVRIRRRIPHFVREAHAGGFGGEGGSGGEGAEDIEGWGGSCS